MSKFICVNEECEKFGVIDERLNNTYKFIDNKLQSNNAPCPKCGKIREEFNENEEIPLSEKNIDIGKYSSVSKQEQKEILKKRSHEHYLKEVKPFKDHQLGEAIKNFKNA